MGSKGHGKTSLPRIDQCEQIKVALGLFLNVEFSLHKMHSIRQIEMFCAYPNDRLFGEKQWTGILETNFIFCELAFYSCRIFL